MGYIIALIATIAAVCLAGILTADNKKKKAAQIAAGACVFLRILGTIGAFLLGCFLGLLSFARKYGK